MKRENLIPLFILVSLIIAMIPAVVMAEVQVSWVDDSILGPQSFLVRAANGSILGSYNTTSDVITLQDNSTYIFQLRPVRDNYLENPLSLVESFMDFAQDNALGLLLVGFLLYVLLMAKGR